MKKKKKPKAYQKPIPIIALNLVDNLLAYIKSYKGPTETCNVFCNINETKSLSIIVFVCHKLFRYKMQEDDNLLDNIKKSRHLQICSLAHKKRRCCHDFVREFPTFVRTLNHPLETMAMKELIMKYVTICLMDKMSKTKKEPKAMMGLRHMEQSIIMQRFKTCYYCDKPGHIM